MYEQPGKCGKSFDYDIIFQARFKRKQAIPKYQPALLIYKLANGHKEVRAISRLFGVSGLFALGLQSRLDPCNGFNGFNIVAIVTLPALALQCIRQRQACSAVNLTPYRSLMMGILRTSKNVEQDEIRTRAHFWTSERLA